MELLYFLWVLLFIIAIATIYYFGRYFQSPSKQNQKNVTLEVIIVIVLLISSIYAGILINL
jgi:high-affinity K+ transport system ATPase subunit B